MQVPSFPEVITLRRKMGRFMATLPQAVCPEGGSRPAAGLLLALLLLAVGGCAQRVYRAARLPGKYVAPATQNVQEANLGKLANYAVNSHVIERGDVLEVTILTDFGDLQTTTTPVRVSEDGRANVPLIGEVALLGLELEAAEQAIAAAGVARGVFRRPHITVTMKQQRKNVITVIGAVEEPGVYELPRRSSTLLAALVSAGGLAEDAGSDVEIRRPRPMGFMPQAPPLRQPRIAAAGAAEPAVYAEQRAGGPYPQITRVNLATAAAEGRGGLSLEDGDVVVVSKRAPKPIYVIGLVRNPGKFELPANHDMYLLDALALAGERTIPVADKVIIVRRVPGEKEPIVIVGSISRAKADGAANSRLAPGDIVSVEETPATIVMRTLTDVLRIGVGSSIALY